MKLPDFLEELNQGAEKAFGGKHDRQPPARKITTETESICQHGPIGERDLRRDSSSS